MPEFALPALRPAPPPAQPPAADRSQAAVWLDKARQGRSVAWLARELGISSRYAGMLILGRRRPSIELAARIHSKLAVPPDAWLYLAE